MDLLDIQQVNIATPGLLNKRNQTGHRLLPEYPE